MAGGLRVDELAAGTRRRLAAFLPATAAVANPVDMIATASAEDYERALGLLLADPDVDAVIAIFIPPLSTRPADVGAAVRRAVEARERDVPVLGVFMTPRAPRSLRTRRVQVPSYAYPEEAARALAAVAGHARWLRRAPGHRPASWRTSAPRRRRRSSPGRCRTPTTATGGWRRPTPRRCWPATASRSWRARLVATAADGRTGRRPSSAARSR